MEGQRFDALTRSLADRATRRQTLKRIGAGVVAIAATAFGRNQTEAATCRDFNAICREDANCCSGFCDPNGANGRRRCTCPPIRDCGDKCCDPGEFCVPQFGCYSLQSSKSLPAVERAWQEVFFGDVLAPMVTLERFEPRVGARFDIRATPRPNTQVVLQAQVVELDAPHRMVFEWIAPGMAEPATAAFTISQTESETVFGINRVSGDPNSCDLATSMLGSNWRLNLFMNTVTANLKRLQITPE